MDEDKWSNNGCKKRLSALSDSCPRQCSSHANLMQPKDLKAVFPKFGSRVWHPNMSPTLWDPGESNMALCVPFVP